MKKHLQRVIGALTLLTVLSGCGSSPSNKLYVLDASEFSPPTGNTPALGVGPITIPEYLGRDKIVYNREGNTLQVATADKWAEPLEDGVQRVLAMNLSSALDTQDVRYFPWHASRPPDYGVKVSILTLDSSTDKAILTAEWLVYSPRDGSPVQRRLSRLEMDIENGPVTAAHLPPAYSALLLQLSEVIAAEISRDMARGEAATP